MLSPDYVDTLVQNALSQQSLPLNEIKQQLGQGVAGVASNVGERSNWYTQVVEHEGLADLAGLSEAFVAAHIRAVRNELCDPRTKSLKDAYQKILGDGETSRLLQALITAILSVIKPEYTIPSVVVPLALWLARVSLNLWCSSASDEQILATTS